MFENKEYMGIYYSRFVASWCKSGGKKIDYYFKEWLGTLKINGENIPEEIIEEIYNYGSNGKLELEVSANEFLAEKQKEEEARLSIVGLFKAQTKLLELSERYAKRAEKMKAHNISERVDFYTAISREILKASGELCEESTAVINKLITE